MPALAPVPPLPLICRAKFVPKLVLGALAAT